MPARGAAIAGQADNAASAASAHMSDNEPPVPPTRAPVAAASGVDVASLWLVALVFVATTALAAQVVWWGAQPPHGLEDRGTWNVLAALSSTLARLPAVRWGALAGVSVLLVATLGLVRGRAWGLVLALPCSAALISCALVGRYAAVFSEPRQFVARSPYVHATVVIALVTLAAHASAILLAARLAYRRPVPLLLARVVLAVLAVLAAILPALRSVDHVPGGADRALIGGVCGAAALAAVIACVAPRRSTVRIGIAAAFLALAALGVGILLHVQDRPRRGGLYSLAAERAIAEIVFAAPFLVAMLAIYLVVLASRARRPPARDAMGSASAR